MAYCRECAARRKLLMEATFEGRLSAAMGHAVAGAAEIVGLKQKTGEAELAAAETASPADQETDAQPYAGPAEDDAATEDGREAE